MTTGCSSPASQCGKVSITPNIALLQKGQPGELDVYSFEIPKGDRVQKNAKSAFIFEKSVSNDGYIGADFLKIIEPYTAQLREEYPDVKVVGEINEGLFKWNCHNYAISHFFPNMFSKKHWVDGLDDSQSYELRMLKDPYTYTLINLFRNVKVLPAKSINEGEFPYCSIGVLQDHKNNTLHSFFIDGSGEITSKIGEGPVCSSSAQTLITIYPRTTKIMFIQPRQGLNLK